MSSSSMDPSLLADALKSMTRRQMEELRSRLDKELQSCILCGTEGAIPYVITRNNRTKGASAARATVLLCVPCFEKIRLPEGRAVEA